MNAKPLGLLLLALVLAVACGAAESNGGSDAKKKKASANDDGDDARGDDATTSDDDSDDDDAAPAPDGAAPNVTLYSAFDLPRTASTRALSAIAFDGKSTLYAIPDRTPQIVPLTADADWKTWTVGTPIALTNLPVGAWDGEGLVWTTAGFYAVTLETAPTLAKLDLSGKWIEKVATPAHYAVQAPGNKGIESLSISPSQKYLFFANEAALTIDGQVSSKTKGTTVRLLRRTLATNMDEEHAYRTEPVGEGAQAGDMGVSDLAAVSDDVVLVLERGYQSGYGSTVRIFKTNLAGDPDVSGTAALSDASPVLKKELLVDLGALPSDGLTHPGTQPNPILDNYEGMALGPTLNDGRRLLFVISDDNESNTQVARVLVLAITSL